MIVIHISAKVKDEAAAGFERSLREVVGEARRANGCLKYEWYRDPDAASRFIIYAEFDSEENFREYLNSAVVQRIGEELMPLIEGGPQFKHLRATEIE